MNKFLYSSCHKDQRRNIKLDFFFYKFLFIFLSEECCTLSLLVSYVKMYGCFRRR